MCRYCSDDREWSEMTEREIEEGLRSWAQIEESAKEINKPIGEKNNERNK